MEITFLDFLSAIGCSCAIIGNYYVIKKNKYAFVIWTIGNFAWILYNIIGPFNMGQFIMFIFYVIINIYGWIKWSYKDENI